MVMLDSLSRIRDICLSSNAIKVVSCTFVVMLFCYLNLIISIQWNDSAAMCTISTF